MDDARMYNVYAEGMDGKRRFIAKARADRGGNGLFDLYADKCEDEEQIVIEEPEPKAMYQGWWHANNSTSSGPYYGTNKHKLAREMRAMCKGNVFAGDQGHWSVSTIDIDGLGRDVTELQGTIRR